VVGEVSPSKPRRLDPPGAKSRRSISTQHCGSNASQLSESSSSPSRPDGTKVTFAWVVSLTEASGSFSLGLVEPGS